MGASHVRCMVDRTWSGVPIMNFLAGRVFATVDLSCERHVHPHRPLVVGEGVAVQGRGLRSVAHGPVLVAFDILARVALRPDEALSRKDATLTPNRSLAAYRF